MSLARVSAILVVIWIVVSAWIIATPIGNVLPAATDHAQSIDFIFKFMMVASVAVFLIVEGFLLYFCLKYRRRKDDPEDAIGSDIHGNTRLEIVWSIIPVIFLVVLTAMSGKVYAEIVATPKHAYVIDALASQFQWECDHPSSKPEIKEFNECHMPLGEVTIKLHARDVIHSFWVPEFRVKQDAVPGYPTVMHFKTTRAGQYRLICAEFCGVGHSEMYAKLFVMTQKDFDNWVKQQQTANSGSGNLTNLSFSKDIEPIFTAHCAACHIAQHFANLDLSSYQGLRKGGNVVPGPIIKPGDHKTSTLWLITSPAGPHPGGARMPLGGPYLSTAELSKIANWIDEGAKNN
ncbi:MAG: cytochrome c oxidase subunit II [Chloroflexota bacterium]